MTQPTLASHATTVRQLCLRFAIATSLLLFAGSSSLAQAPFTQGTRVAVAVDSLRVRNAATESAVVTGGQSLNDQGTIVDASPHYADGYWWWRVDFDEGADGWVAQGTTEVPFLTAVATPDVPTLTSAEQEAVEEGNCYILTREWGCFLDQAQRAGWQSRTVASYRGQLGQFDVMNQLLASDDDEFRRQGILAFVMRRQAEGGDLLAALSFASVPTRAEDRAYLQSAYQGMLLRLGDLDAAARFIQTIPDVQQRTGALRGLSLAHLEQGNIEMAITTARQMPADSQEMTLETIVSTLAAGQRFEEAITLAQGLGERRDFALDSIARELFRAGQDARAFEVRAQTTRDGSSLINAVFRLADAGDLATAMEYYRDHLNPADQDRAHGRLILGFGRTGMIAEAEALYATVNQHALTEHQRVALDKSMGIAYILNGQADKALALYETHDADDVQTLLRDATRELAASDMNPRDAIRFVKNLPATADPTAAIRELLNGAFASRDMGRFSALVAGLQPTESTIVEAVRWARQTHEDAASTLSDVAPYLSNELYLSRVGRDLYTGFVGQEIPQYASAATILDVGVPMYLEPSEIIEAYAKGGRPAAAYEYMVLIDGWGAALRPLLMIAESYQNAGNPERAQEVLHEALTHLHTVPDDDKPSIYLWIAKIALDLDDIYWGV